MFERLEIDTPKVPNSFESYRAGLGTPPQQTRTVCGEQSPRGGKRPNIVLVSRRHDVVAVLHGPTVRNIWVSICRGVFPADGC